MFMTWDLIAAECASGFLWYAAIAGPCFARIDIGILKSFSGLSRPCCFAYWSRMNCFPPSTFDRSSSHLYSP